MFGGHELFPCPNFLPSSGVANKSFFCRDRRGKKIGVEKENHFFAASICSLRGKNGAHRL
jgi:hypothetical protein